MARTNKGNVIIFDSSNWKTDIEKNGTQSDSNKSKEVLADE